MEKKSVRAMSDGELAETFNYFEAKRARREAFQLLALVNPRGGSLAQLAAEDLKASKEIIYEAANRDRSEFFIELGKLLEGKRLKPNTWSKLDIDIAFILCFNPKIKSTGAVDLLEGRGHRISPLAFKQKKYNWRKLAAARRRNLFEKAGLKFLLANSFLDDDTP